MEKYLKHLKYTGILAGTLLSMAFTFMLFLNLATDIVSTILFGGAAIIIESCKMSLIINALKRDKAFKVSIAFAILFFIISLSASISYTTYTTSNALYETVGQLKDNSLSGFFTLLSTITGLQINTILIAFSVIIGIALDMTGLCFAILKQAQRPKSAMKNKPKTNERDKTTKPDSNKVIEIKNYNDFIKYADTNGLDLLNLKYTEFIKFVPEFKKSTFYSYVKKLRNA